MAIGIITHPDCTLHKIDGHPERPERIEVIQNELLNQKLVPQLKFYEAPLATPTQLSLVHGTDYIDSIFQLSPKQGFLAIDEDTWMNPHTVNAALRAAGAVVFAVDLIMKKEITSVFCNVRPPGHHAERNQAMGFCFFNNVAVGVAYALEHYSLSRIAIVDFDVHHGNGTEDIFKNEPRVLLCSSFQYPLYPNKGNDTRSNHIINLPLPAGTDGKKFREKFSTHFIPALKNFKPELIFISAGFDAHEKDELANLSLQAEDYAWIIREVKKIANEFCEGKIISVLEGGYDLGALAESAVAHIKEL